jgi:sensor c-di-GMP phosphodiesterase-like protein
MEVSPRVGSAGVVRLPRAYAPLVHTDKIDAVAIRAGMERKEFYLEYLPAISLTDGRCVGAEALTRWRRPTGLVPPDVFIPIAERCQLSGLITHWVIETLAVELRGWLEAHRDAYISFNVPPELLGRGGLEQAAKTSGLLPLKSQLVLEITERGVPDSVGVGALAGDSKFEIRVALDDVTFAGGANLAILSRCKFSYIKLDRSLISQIRADCTAPSWLVGVAALLKTSTVAAIAEGVETKLQADVLRDAGVQSAQGFYFSHPIPVADFIAFHRRTQPTRAAP